MRATGVVFGILTVVLALATALWTPLVVPKVVVLPADFATTVGVSGTFEAQAAPGTLARLPAPVTLPLNATLQVQSVSADGNLLVISQVVTQKVGAPTGPTQDLTINSQFVLDRSTAQNVEDPRSWSVNPSHVVNRSGTYSFTFGFDFDPNATYQLWDDSIGAGYPLSQGGNAASAPTGGLTVTGMTGTATKPADPAWIAALTPLQLPTSLTPAQWTAAGFTVTSSQPQVDAAYFVTLSTQVSVDHVTGGTVDLSAQSLTISVAPDPAATNGTPATPQTIAVNTFAETPQSAATDTALLASDGSKVTLAKTTIPRVLLAATIVSALLTALFFVLHRRRRGSAPAD
jgi:hypothetical protein